MPPRHPAPHRTEPPQEPTLHAQALEAIQDGVIVTDAKGMVVLVNPAAQRIYGRERLPCAGIFLSDCCPENWVQCKKALTSGEAQRGLRLRLPAATAMVSHTPIVEQGQIRGVLIVMQPMEHLERLAPLLEAYQRLDQRAAQLLDHNPGGMMLVGADGVVAYVNAAFLHFSGLKRQETLGCALETLYDDMGFMARVREVMQSLRPYAALRTLKSGVELLFTVQPCFERVGQLASISVQLMDCHTLYTLARKEAEPSFPPPDGVLEEQEMLRRIAQEANIVARSKSMLQVLQKALKVSRVESSVLLLGESGVGKSTLAALIHKNSPRRDNPFIAINCGAIPESLMESELFGYERGAFTGASAQGKAGLLDSAHKGTVFFDEIGELPLSMQVKLLEAIDQKSFLRVGGTKRVHVDIRILAATNRVLEQEVETGAFRRDLFFRLNVIPIHIPPLRERREDMEIMAQNILARHNVYYNAHKRISQGVFDVLMRHHFPGNMRELVNIMEWMVVMGESDLLTVDDLPASLRAPLPGGAPRGLTRLKQAAEEAERHCILEALRQCATNAQAARVLGVHVTTLWRKMSQYNIQGHAVV